MVIWLLQDAAKGLADGLNADGATPPPPGGETAGYEGRWRRILGDGGFGQW